MVGAGCQWGWFGWIIVLAQVLLDADFAGSARVCEAAECRGGDDRRGGRLSPGCRGWDGSDERGVQAGGRRDLLSH